MALKNVACPECGNNVSFTISSDEEVYKIRKGRSDKSKKCGNCGQRVGIGVAPA